MEIKLEIVPRKMISGFTMFAQFNRELLKETKTVEVNSHLVTKTRVSTSMQIGEACMKINFVIDGFKTFEKTEYNYFSSKEVTSNYFVLSKQQNLERYKEYVIEAVRKSINLIGVDLDELTIKLEQPKFL